MPPFKPHVDWEAVWKSLNWDDESRQDDAEHERLRQRAQQYAAPLVEAQIIPDDARSVLTFDLGSEHYGVDVTSVRGVRAAPHITAVPGAPNFYRGVINLRGKIVTVLDLRLFFGLNTPDTLNLPGEIVITQAGNLQLALLAQQIKGVVSLAASEIKSVEHLAYAIGITRDRTIVLNINQLFEDTRLVVGVNS